MKNLKLFLYLYCFVLFSCQKVTDTKIETSSHKSSIKYAKGFDIIDNQNGKTLVIKSAYQDVDKTFSYLIKKKNGTNNKKNTISTPIAKMVLTSTTHIPMVELLQKENTIIGFPFSRYVSSEKTRKLIDNGNIVEIGKEGSLNTEILLDLQPELVVGYSVSAADKALTTLQNSGISVIYNGDWLEETPLGRAEWIKFFGVLYDKESKADSIFKTIEHNYKIAKEMALKSTTKPTIISGAIMSNDIWNLPAGQSFVAQFLADANLNYLWGNSTGKGSLSLSFESVFEKGLNADYWIAPGYYNSKQQMLDANPLYANFKAFKNDHIYSPTIKKGKTGGVLYYELAPTRPDLVLKDLIKITNPDALPNHKLVFFEKMN